MTAFVSELFNAAHDVAGFDSGEPLLDDWLRGHAVRAGQQGTSSTHVWVDDHVVRAFYSVAPTQVLRGEVTSAQAGGNAVIPAYLIGRLALDRAVQGQGLGTQLLLDALEIVVSASRWTGGRLIVVDALNTKARRFYAERGFLASKTPDRLVMKIATARLVLGTA